MNTPKHKGIWNLVFWIFIFHIPLILNVSDQFAGKLLSEPKYENNAIIGIIATGLAMLGLTTWLYIPAIILCIWVVGERPPEIAIIAFSSCQAFIMALSLWLFKRAKSRNLAKL